MCCLPALVALAPSIVLAQGDDAQQEAAARALFEQASQLMDQKKFAEACPKLEAVVKLAPKGNGARMTLAECYESVDKLASAWATYSQAEASARSAQQVDRERAAHDKAASLKPRLATLTITVPANVAGLPGLALKRDGAEVTSVQWGVALPVDKGNHALLATANGGAAWQKTVAIQADGTNETVTIGDLQAAGAADTLAPRSASSPPVSSSSSTQRVAGIAVGGLGLVGVVVGAVFGLKAFSKNSDSNADGHCHDGNLCDPIGVQLRADSRSAGTISTIAFVAGGVALGAGVVLFATAPKAKAADAQVGIGPRGLELRGAW